VHKEFFGTTVCHAARGEVSLKALHNPHKRRRRSCNPYPRPRGCIASCIDRDGTSLVVCATRNDELLLLRLGLRFVGYFLGFAGAILFLFGCGESFLKTDHVFARSEYIKRFGFLAQLFLGVVRGFDR
jgi:hypothetical protein